MTANASARTGGNRFDRMEWAGAFGDLGTLIPFAVAYITLLKVNPFGILFAFGVAMIVTGFYYRTPFPVQPMKAIGAVATTQAAQSIVIVPNAVYAAGLVTGLIWLLLGLTGAAKKIAEFVSRPVAMGIILGLGFGFMFEGVKMMSGNWWLGACDFSKDKGERFVTLATAAFAVWNIGIAFVFGFAAYHAHKRRLFQI